ncbi:MAG: hypothetical protein ACYS47_20100 [Planctomycetota bacterium]|jgi:hypothetical protein
MGKKALDVIVKWITVTFLATTVALFIFCVDLQRRVSRLELRVERDEVERDRREKEERRELQDRLEREEKLLELLRIHGGTRCFDRVHVGDAEIDEARALLEEAREAIGPEKAMVEPTIAATTRKLIELVEGSRRGD